MKKILLIIQLLILQNFCSAQIIPRNNNIDTFRFGRGPMPILVLNGNRISTTVFDNEYGKDKKKEIGAVILEGDSSYRKKTGSSESILKKYFGNEVVNGVLLMFTPEVVTILNGHSMRAYLRKNKDSTLWSISEVKGYLIFEKRIIKNYGIKNIDKIEVINKIGFQNTDGSTDFFNIVIVFLKRKFLLDLYRQ